LWYNRSLCSQSRQAELSKVLCVMHLSDIVNQDFYGAWIHEIWDKMWVTQAGGPFRCAQRSSKITLGQTHIVAIGYFVMMEIHSKCKRNPQRNTINRLASAFQGRVRIFWPISSWLSASRQTRWHQWDVVS
jgi:hypothetical protein